MIPALREQTVALATQAAGVNHQTLNDAERTAFYDTIDLVKSTVFTRLQEVMGSVNDHKGVDNDNKELSALIKTLTSLQFKFGTTKAFVTTMTGHHAITAPLLNATATVRDLKIAAANALTIPFESIKAVAIGRKVYDDNVLISSKLARRVMVIT
ncbi:MAG: hypothetical protein WA347_06455 [Rhabdochlamydiaceae bacterium]|jgi:hypothetical protein